MSELQDALDTLTDGDERLREMTRHNAADFVQAIAVVVEAARLVANPNYGAAQRVLERQVNPMGYSNAQLIVDAALGITEDTE